MTLIGMGERRKRHLAKSREIVTTLVLNHLPESEEAMRSKSERVLGEKRLPE